MENLALNILIRAKAEIEQTLEGARNETDQAKIQECLEKVFALFTVIQMVNNDIQDPSLSDFWKRN